MQNICKSKMDISMNKFYNFFNYLNQLPYNINFSFKIENNKLDNIKNIIDSISNNLIPRVTSYENYKTGRLYNIVWLQKINKKNKYYDICKHKINDTETLCKIIIFGNLHKIDSGFNINNIRNRNFLELP